MGALLDAVPAGGADHTEHHRDLATAIEAVPAAYQPLDSDLTAIAALTTTAYGRGLLSLANQAALQAEAGGSALVAGVDYPTHSTVTLSSAQILDLHNTPITLVAAPGAGKMIWPDRVIATLDYGTTEYTVGGTVDIGVNADGDKVWFSIGASVDPEQDNVWTGLVEAANTLSPALVGNMPLVVTATAAVTLGDGTLTVTVWYTIEDVPA